MAPLHYQYNAKLVKDRDDIIKSYEQSLTQMNHSAIAVALLHICTRYVSLSATTWAALLLLGAFATNLSSIDLYLLHALLFIEAVRFSTLAFFTHLLTRDFTSISYTSNPTLLSYTSIHQSKRQLSIGNFALALRTFLILPTLFASFCRLQHLYGARDINEAATTPCNFHFSLAFFYTLLLANSLLAALALASQVILWRIMFPAGSVMLEKYRAAVMEKALRVGLLDATDLDFFGFAFRELSKDYARNLQPLTVKKQNEELVRYLYAHRKGVEVVYEYLRSKDTFEQQAAAIMVGFWAKERGIASQRHLLSRVATKVGIGQTGWAAANALNLLAKLYPDTIAAVEDEISGRSLVHNILPLLHNNNSMVLVLVRILVSLFKAERIVQSMEPDLLQRLEERLRIIFWENKRQRTRTLGGFALRLLGRMSSADKMMVGSINPSKDSYFLQEEKEMLDQLYEFAGLSLYPKWHECEIRQFN